MRYQVSFSTNLSVDVVLEADDEEQAADDAWEVAQEFADRLGTQPGDHRILSAEASFDGIGADDVREVPL